VKIEHIPTRPPGEISLELQGDTVIVERRLYGPRAGPGVEPQRDRVSQISVPVEEMWRVLIQGLEGFRFEGLSADELRAGLDFARSYGWGQ
jgi:hypothetical protein